MFKIRPKTGCYLTCLSAQLKKSFFLHSKLCYFWTTKIAKTKFATVTALSTTVNAGSVPGQKQDHRLTGYQRLITYCRSIALSVALPIHRLLEYTRRANKKESPIGKILHLRKFGRFFLPHLQHPPRKIQATHVANFVKTAHTVQQAQRFKLRSSLFK